MFIMFLSANFNRRHKIIFIPTLTTWSSLRAVSPTGWKLGQSKIPPPGSEIIGSACNSFKKGWSIP